MPNAAPTASSRSVTDGGNCGPSDVSRPPSSRRGAQAAHGLGIQLREPITTQGPCDAARPVAGPIDGMNGPASIWPRKGTPRRAKGAIEATYGSRIAYKYDTVGKINEEEH